MASRATRQLKDSGIAQRRAAAKAEGGEQYQARRRALVAAAAAVFREKGVAAASVDDIARAAGLDRATLYYYAGNKDELFREVVADAAIGNIELAERIAANDDPPAQKLEALITGVIASYASFYPHLYVFLREDPSTLPTSPQPGFDIVELSRRFDRALVSVLRAGVESGEFRADLPPRMVAYAIVGMLNWTHRWFDPDGPVGADEVADTFARLVIDGLRAT